MVLLTNTRYNNSHLYRAHMKTVQIAARNVIPRVQGYVEIARHQVYRFSEIFLRYLVFLSFSNELKKLLTP